MLFSRFVSAATVFVLVQHAISVFTHGMKCKISPDGVAIAPRVVTLFNAISCRVAIV